MFLYNREMLLIKTKLFLIILILSVFTPMTLQANDSVVPYSVEANLPDNQINNDISYFDIEMEPGDSQTLKVTVYNSSAEEITIHINNTIASTNSNGLIVYDGLEEDEEPHESMEHPFRDISSLESTEITVPAGEQEIVEVEVDAPEESFDGVILGGLHFTLEPDESSAENSVMIQNRYSYALAVQISEVGNSNEVSPDIELLGVDPGVINYRTGLQSEFVNTSSMIISGLTVEAGVYESDSEEALYTSNAEDFTVAPNSRFNFPVLYNNQRLEAGDYIFKTSISNEYHSWEFEEEFEVTEELANEANEEAVEVDEEDSNWLMYLVIALAIIIIVLIIILLMVLKRKK